MKKIAFMGAHSSAKTTTVNRMVTVLRDMGYNVGVITEVARDCPFEIDISGSFGAQLWMIQEQARREIELTRGEPGKYFLIICDRCVWDNLAYSLSLHEMGKISDIELRVIQDTVRTWAEFLKYDHIYFCEPKPLYEDGVRSTDVEWRDNVYQWFKRMIKSEKIEVTIVQ